jgi:hypothetical protein
VPGHMQQRYKHQHLRYLQQVFIGGVISIPSIVVCSVDMSHCLRPAVCRCSALFLTLTKMLSKVPLFMHGLFHVCYHTLFHRRQFCTRVRQPCIRELRQRQGTPTLLLLAGIVAADVLPQVVKVWDCRQRDAVMQLPNWHSSVINTIKCVHARAQSVLSNTLYQVPSHSAASYNDVRHRSDSEGNCCSLQQPWAASSPVARLPDAACSSLTYGTRASAHRIMERSKAS